MAVNGDKFHENDVLAVRGAVETSGSTSIWYAKCNRIADDGKNIDVAWFWAVSELKKHEDQGIRQVRPSGTDQKR